MVSSLKCQFDDVPTVAPLNCATVGAFRRARRARADGGARKRILGWTEEEMGGFSLDRIFVPAVVTQVRQGFQKQARLREPDGMLQVAIRGGPWVIMVPA